MAHKYSGMVPSSIFMPRWHENPPSAFFDAAQDTELRKPRPVFKWVTKSSTVQFPGGGGPLGFLKTGWPTEVMRNTGAGCVVDTGRVGGCLKPSEVYMLERAEKYNSVKSKPVTVPGIHAGCPIHLLSLFGLYVDLGSYHRALLVPGCLLLLELPVILLLPLLRHSIDTGRKHVAKVQGGNDFWHKVDRTFAALLRRYVLFSSPTLSPHSIQPVARSNIILNQMILFRCCPSS